MKSSTWLSIALASASVGFGLIGCGGDDDDDGGGNMSEAGSPSAGSGASSNGGTAVNAAGAESEGGMATAPIGGEPSAGGTPGMVTGGAPSTVDTGGTGDGGASPGAGGATATDVQIHAGVLTDSRGFSLYIREGDTASKTDPVSGCTAGCLTTWPLFAVEDPTVPDELSAADFGAFERPDGETQATYQGWPLYYFGADKAPGNTKGDGVGKIWHVVAIPFVAP
jgi:predicted lipoprotein with Yx(FWY)xxD motif